MTLEHIDLPNIGFTLDKVPVDIIQQLKVDTNNLLEKSQQELDTIRQIHAVSGHVKNEYRFDPVPEYLNNYLLWLANAHDSKYNYVDSQNNVRHDWELKLTDCWVNNQGSGEFNPLHGHNGVYSFVIWLDIPYTMEDEHEYFPHADYLKSGTFEFAYTNTLGVIKGFRIPTDKKMNGKIALFPAGMRHVVYPFATKNIGNRISISGNLNIVPT